MVCFAQLTLRRIDGRVQSVLVGGHDVGAVLSREDNWYCQFFEYASLSNGSVARGLTLISNYDCKSDNGDEYLTFADGANNLASIGWGTKIHSLRCCNQSPSDS